MDFKTDILPLKNKLYRLALRITLNPHEAEDIVQDTLIRVWNRRDTWDQIESIDAFTTTICRNIALDYNKRHDNHNASLDEMTIERVDNSADPLLQLEHNDNINRIQSIMNALPEKQRTCMQLRDFEGKTYKEIADILSITEEQVKISIFRARKAVKESILNTK